MREAYAIRQEVDDYVDQKLANFEVVLNKTLSAVHRGREKLRGRQELDELGDHVEALGGGTGPGLARSDRPAAEPLLE